jgi:transcriptional regulator with PAS, ATPase and Fis domain
VAVNCASLPEGLLESELFGTKKAVSPGRWPARPASSSWPTRATILLDEISEMNIALQAKLLRVLQRGKSTGSEARTRCHRRPGHRHHQPQPQEWRPEGIFRQDLYYRLNVIPLTIPPLRQRPSTFRFWRIFPAEICPANAVRSSGWLRTAWSACGH